jgi:hypothetical protein
MDKFLVAKFHDGDIYDIFTVNDYYQIDGKASLIVLSEHNSLQEALKARDRANTKLKSNSAAGNHKQ